MTTAQEFRPPFGPAKYLQIRRAVIQAGFGWEYEMIQSVKPPKRAEKFASELIFVICNSGIKNSVAIEIFERVERALRATGFVGSAFNHPGKVSAIEKIWRERHQLFEAYRAASDKIAWLRTLPWIGSTTCYHAARNFGIDCVKPDIHLKRIAEAHGETPLALCRRLQGKSRDRIGTVDVILWRASAIGLIKTRKLVGVTTLRGFRHR